MEKCPQCDGIGNIYSHPSKRKKYIQCDLCEGIGLVEDRKILWRIKGEALREWRIKNKLTLRMASEQCDIDPSNLSKMERGVLKPYAYYLN